MSFYTSDTYKIIIILLKYLLNYLNDKYIHITQNMLLEKNTSTQKIIVIFYCSIICDKENRETKCLCITNDQVNTYTKAISKRK